jgi:hypothetical protein
VTDGVEISMTLSRWPDAVPTTLAVVVQWTYGFAICYGVLRADNCALREIEEAVPTAEGASDDNTVSVAEYTLGIALLYRDDPADRQRGYGLCDIKSQSPKCTPRGRLPDKATKTK